MTDLYEELSHAEKEQEEKTSALREATAKVNALRNAIKKQKPVIVCEDNLLPGGETCPACGLPRAASAAIDGWVHYPTRVISRKKLSLVVNAAERLVGLMDDEDEDMIFAILRVREGLKNDY